jgi:hypothetical protein
MIHVRSTRTSAFSPATRSILESIISLSSQVKYLQGLWLHKECDSPSSKKLWYGNVLATTYRSHRSWITFNLHRIDPGGLEKPAWSLDLTLHKAWIVKILILGRCLSILRLAICGDFRVFHHVTGARLGYTEGNRFEDTFARQHFLI